MPCIAQSLGRYRQATYALNTLHLIKKNRGQFPKVFHAILSNYYHRKMEHQNKHANIKVVSKSVQSDIIVQTEQTLIYNMKSRVTTSSTPIEINYEIR